MNKKQKKKAIKPNKNNKNNKASSQKKPRKSSNISVGKTGSTSKSSRKTNTNKQISNTGKSLNSSKNKKNTAMKFKRRRRFLALIIVIVFIGVITIYKLKTPSVNKINKYMTQGNNYILNNQYQNAMNSYEEVLKLDKTNQNAQNLVSILQCYLKAESDYKNGNATEALQDLNGINPNYTRYPIGVKVNQLKSEIDSNGNSSQSKASNQAKQDLMELNTLYSSGQYQKALDVINRLNGEQLNSTQQAYVSEIASSVEKSLGESATGKTKFSKKGNALNDLDQLTKNINCMDLNAKTYEQKLQRAKDQYSAWNNEMNKIYGQLQNTLTAQQVSSMESNQQAWVQQKTQQATQSESGYNQQIVKETANYQTQSTLTRERCYYLVNTYF